MRKLFIASLLALFAFTVNAQETSSELELYQSVFNAEKKAMVIEFMALSETEATAFWEVYNAYETDRAEVGKLRVKLLNDYADSYEKMTDESAATILKEANDFSGKLNKVKVKYSKKMAKAIGAKKGLQWIQFEEYLDRVIGLYIMENVPFVGEYN